MNVADVAARLSAALDLDIDPIALSRSAGPPAGVRQFEGSVPSTCTFWRRAEQDVFYASAGQHFRCPIGAMVMGFDLPQSVQAELEGMVGMMIESKYLSAAEPAHIPTLTGTPSGIVYGPLKRFPIDPEFILLWLTPSQAMTLTEATGGSHWATSEPSATLGRPACAAIPAAAARGSLALSLGCTGMRTYTEIADDRVLAVLPAARASAVVAALAATVQVNGVFAAFHEKRKTGA